MIQETDIEKVEFTCAIKNSPIKMILKHIPTQITVEGFGEKTTPRRHVYNKLLTELEQKIT